MTCQLRWCRSLSATVGVVALVVCGASWLGAAETGGRVELVGQGGKWQLVRNGQAFAIKGAGGDGSREVLAKVGGNSVRTWGAENVGPMLDEAQKLGLTVTVGIWLGHERHGFDYTKLDQVAKQYEGARQTVLKHKDHPALLMWGLGNEMEGSKGGDNAAIWSAVNNIAAMVKKVDGNHPTMTVVAEVGGRKIEAIHRLCPEIDVVGINSYGGARSIPERYRKAGGSKPYVVTEFGPPGVWEVGRNGWGVAQEATSTQKGEFYRKAYEALAADGGLCLGSYAFAWGYKQEATATWFGMFLPDGSRLEAVDVMGQLWSGKAPANRCPKITKLSVAGAEQVEGGATVMAKLEASDPEGDELKVKWVLARESGNESVGGDRQGAPPTFPDAIVKADAGGAEVRMPKDGGGYRLFAYVYDGKGGAATANVPLKVNGPEEVVKAKSSKLPLAVVGDDIKAAYVASGWMGEAAAVKMDETCTDEPHTGKTCVKVEYDKADGWAGVVWQDPENDWGDKAGGYDLRGAKKLVLWARGKDGGEKVKFGFGVLGAEKKHHDSAKGEVEVVLAREWKEHSIDLGGKDLSKIKTGFMWTVGGQGKAVTFYLDDVRYE